MPRLLIDRAFGTRLIRGTSLQRVYIGELGRYHLYLHDRVG